MKEINSTTVNHAFHKKKMAYVNPTGLWLWVWKEIEIRGRFLFVCSREAGGSLVKKKQFKWENAVDILVG